MILALKSGLSNVDTLLFSPDGRTLVAVNETHHVVWRDWAAGGDPGPVITTESRPSNSAFGPDGSCLFMNLHIGEGVKARPRARVLDLNTGVLEPCGITPICTSWFHFEASGGYAIASHGNCKLSRSDLAPGSRKLKQRWTLDLPGVFPHYAFGHVCGANGTFASVDVQSRSGNPIDGLVIRSTADGSVQQRLEINDADAQRMLESVPKRAFHPAGKHVASSWPQDIVFYSLDGSPAPKAIPQPPGSLGFQGIAYHPNGRLLAVADYGDTVSLYDTKTGRVEHTFTAKNRKGKVRYLQAVSFTRDGKFLAAAGDKGLIAVWDADL